MAKNKRNSKLSLRVSTAEPSSEALTQSTSVDSSLSGKMNMYASDPSEHRIFELPFIPYFVSCFVILIQAGLRSSSEVADEVETSSSGTCWDTTSWNEDGHSGSLYSMWASIVSSRPSMVGQ